MVMNDLDIDETKKHIYKMYKYAKSEEDADKIIQIIKNKCSKNSSGLTLNDAISNP
jgi:hypothetical protein